MDTGRWLNTVAFVQYVKKKKKDRKQEQDRAASFSLLTTEAKGEQQVFQGKKNLLPLTPIA